MKTPTCRCGTSWHQRGDATAVQLPKTHTDGVDRLVATGKIQVAA